MTKQVQRRRGTTAQHTGFTGAEGEITVNTTNKSAVVHDGATAGGVEAARADLVNVDGADIVSTISGETVASLTVTSADINGGNIDDTAVGASTPSSGAFTTLTTTGGATIGGDLTVNGTTTTINSTTLTVDDLNVTLASGAADAAAANGAGITVDGASATFNYASTGDKWTMNKPLDVTGNIIVSGTVDGRDVATDGTKLDGIATNAIANVVEDTTPQLGGDLDVNGNDINFGDNDKAIFGAGNDLQIYHDVSNSYIDEVGAGVLKIRSNGTGVDFESTGGETLAQFVTNGAVTLYHNNSPKISTTSGGINVTGTMTSDGLTVDGNVTSADLVYFNNTSATQSDVLRLNTAGVGIGTNILDVQSGDTTRFLVRGDGNVGIGTSSPLDLVHLKEANGTATSTQLLLHNNNTGSGSAGVAFSVIGDGETTSYAPKGAILFERTASNGRGVFKFMSDNVDDTNPFSAADEVMRIDSSGHLIAPNGITLGTAVGTYNAANTLDDYEEGSWTCTPIDQSGNSSSTTVEANYTKIGNVVTVTFSTLANISTTGLTGTDNMLLDGLPFTVSGNAAGSASCNRVTFASGKTMNIPRAQNNTTYIQFIQDGNDSNAVIATVGDFFSGGADVTGLSLTYITNQ